MSKNKLSRRITWRVIGIMVFFNVLIIAAILFFVRDVSLLLGSSRCQYVSEGIGGKIESMLEAVEGVTKNSRAELEENMDSPEKIFDALEHEIRINQLAVGYFAAFEPDYFKNQGRWFEAYVYHADSTQYARKQIGSPNHDYFNSIWYKKGISLDKGEIGFLSDPYFDDSVVSGTYSSFVVPIFDRQNRKVGVFGVDLNISWLDYTLRFDMDNVKKEFLEDKALIGPGGEILFSIQIIDSKGNRITGTDSLDLNILKSEQINVFNGFGTKDLKGTPYYVQSKQIANTGWSIVVFQHYFLMFTWGLYLAIVIAICMCVGGLVIFFFMRLSIHRAIKPLGYLSDSAQQVAKGNFDTMLPSFTSKDEITQLRDSFDTMQNSLKGYVEQLKETTASKATIESELNVAHNIQMSMLPKSFPPYPNRNDIELYGSLTPAKAVGGDLYDFFINDEKLFFCIGDVSGKGVPASLVMAVSRTLFRNVSAHTVEPSHIVKTMNTAISEGNDNNMFVTLFVGILDLKTGRLRYCNAGHDAPYINKSLLPCEPNLPVGVLPGMSFCEQETMMETGSTIFLYTDGLTEAMNAKRELFGEQRITDIISAFTGSTQELIETMAAAVHEFVGDTEQSDDLTMLAIRYTQQNK